ncbi:Acetyltransferase (GNAT) family protein [Paenibacillus sp. yr247]|uniref:GNAT family N-acetyltransferase n=1 Tax=Paenibacillus sp. yr247 TaxID=1761880 RepID=UPI0008866248|nr:GNAT family N-acetyltransferase [Paenibacillus sp. yr247]SDP12943.1 Acetyltransferase (GNAT) family protein [Paenibacillus sp. yr247]
MRYEFDELLISDEKELLQIDVIAGFLSRSYWANKRSITTIQKSIEASLCVGVYHDRKQIGFARIVTDHATMYWLADVYVDEDYRGRSIGKKLIETITNSEDLKDLVGILGTKDAHELYEQYGFERDAARFMRRAPENG